MKTFDPQIVVEGVLKPGKETDIVVFSIPLSLFEIVCIVNVPLEGETKAPVYVKFKLLRSKGNVRK